MNNKIIIRPASEPDIPALADLCGQLGYPSSPEAVISRLTAIRSRPDNVIFVAEVDHKVAGWIHLFVCRLLESDPYVEIGGLVVNETWRNLGIGRKLVAQAEDWTRMQRYPNIRVRSNIIRHQAHKFYETLGYTNTKTQFTFTKGL